MKLEDHDAIRVSWAQQLFAGLGSEETVLEDVKIIKQANDQDYLEIKPFGQSSSGHILMSENQKLVPNLYRTLKSHLGKPKREVGKVQVDKDLTII